MRLTSALFTVASLLSCPPLFATINGTNLIGVTPDTLGMAGAGSARLSSVGQALYQNPALLAKMNKDKSFGLALTSVSTSYKVSVDDTTINQALNGGAAPGVETSEFRTPLVPALYAAARYNDQFAFGLGLLAYSGIGADFSDSSSHLRVSTEAALVRIPLAIAYAPNESFALGLSVLGVAGELAIQTADPALGGPQSKHRKIKAQNAGFQFGTVYQPLAQLALALQYISPVRLTYREVADLQALSLSNGFAGDGNREDLTLEQPAEWGLGLNYSVTANWDLALDFRQLAYSQAAGYKDFDWKDQTVFALGSAMTWDALTLNLGVNYGQAPISDRTYADAFARTSQISGVQLPRYSLAATNALGLGVITELSFGFGGRYQWTEDLSFAGAFTYAPEARMIQQGSYIGQSPTDGSFYPGNYRYETKLTVWSATLGIQKDI